VPVIFHVFDDKNDQTAENCLVYARQLVGYLQPFFLIVKVAELLLLVVVLLLELLSPRVGLLEINIKVADVGLVQISDNRIADPGAKCWPIELTLGQFYHNRLRFLNVYR